MRQFPFYLQMDAMDCGPTCLKMIAKYYGRTISLQQLRDICNINREGTSLLGLSEGAEKLGFRTAGVQLGLKELESQVLLPTIVHWRQEHFVVVYRITKNKIYVSDPAMDRIEYSKQEFCDNWISSRSNGQDVGIALILEPTPEFYTSEEEQPEGLSFSRVFSYLFSYKRLLVQLLLGLLFGSVLQVIFPIITQAIVDIGINTRNLGFVYLMLFAQLMLFAGRTTMEFIRSWILLHIGTRINISLLSDFLLKLMRLPVSFFETKMVGDLMQRLQDHKRVEEFLTGNTLQTLFSVVNLMVFGVVLAFYDSSIFLLFLLGTLLYAVWISLFLKKRMKLDYKRFEIAAKNQSKLVQLIQGMQEIKLSNSETLRRWEWESLQARLFKLNIKGLALNQYQQAGAFCLNEVKNILITFLAAKAVIEGNMTLGTMLAISYIIGQLNSPIEQLIAFMQGLQDAAISLERMNEIHRMEDEEPASLNKPYILPINKSFFLKEVSFAYPGDLTEPVLKNIELFIPEGKVTAIVGMSGSGKTTLLKLLLKFYEPTSGEIRIGEAHLKNISHSLWRSQCGVVMQDGYILSDTIAKNIALSDEYPDMEKLRHAVKVANISSFIDSLPLGFNTKIGDEGNGLSQGQKQRLLIARAVYKNPSFIFLDEATNALDANNEKVIMDNLNDFFKGRTVVVVAHRLSTVQHADQIVVLHKGKITEVGNHSVLTGKRGEYYNLVKNQLELGN